MKDNIQKGATPMLWKVERDGQTSYLLGAISKVPSQKQEFILNRVAETGIWEDIDVLVTEYKPFKVNTDVSQSIQALGSQAIEKNKNLITLDTKTYISLQLAKAFFRNAVTPKNLVKGGLITVTLPVSGVPFLIYNRYSNKKSQKLVLETYFAEDIRKANKKARQAPGTRKYLVDDRSEKWWHDNDLESLLTKNKALLVVSAANLFGKHGMLAHLQDKDFTLTAMNWLGNGNQMQKIANSDSTSARRL